MDIKKIFNLVISDFIKYADGAGIHTIRLGRYKDKIAIIDSGIKLFLIDEKRFPFKLDICGDLITVDRIIPDKSDYEDAQNTNRLIELGKCTVAVIESESGSAWVNVVLLKEYGKDLKFMTAKNKPEIKPVLIYRGDTLLGLVMPTKQSTKNKFN